MWKDLRDLRKKQNFTITGHKLAIHKEAANLEEDKKIWKYEIDKEFLERVQEAEERKKVEEKEYEAAMTQWKKLHAERREVRQRHKKHQRDMERGRGGVDATQFAEDEETLAKPEPEKPDQPVQFEAAKVREELEAAAGRCRRQPGEPRLILELTLTGGVTRTADIYDNREVNRQNAVSKTKVFIKVFFNGKEVCQTSSKLIGQDFVVPIGHIFPIQIVHWPQTLTLEINEGSSLRTTTIVEVPLPLPAATQGLDKASVEAHEFTSNVEVGHGHSGLGSGRQFSTLADHSKVDSSLTRGTLYVRVGWGRGPDGSLLAPPDDQWSPSPRAKVDHYSEVFDSEGRVDPEKLEEWLLSHRIDPNDPSNADLMSQLGAARGRGSVFRAGEVGEGKDGGEDHGCFRLDQMEDQFAFCSEEEIQSNLRFQMLQLRNAKAPEFRNYRMLPALEKEIPKGILEAHAKRLEMNRKEVVSASDPLRAPHRLEVEKMRAQVSHKFSIAKHRKRREDLIVEDAIPDLTTLFQMLGGMAPAQRPLRPVRTERKLVTIQDLSGQEVKLLLCVVRAYDVPVRQDVDPLTTREGPRESQVAPFLEATFQVSFLPRYDQPRIVSLKGTTLRTGTGSGPNPAWNQQLELTFKPPNNDFSPESMNRVQDCLHLHLFDQVVPQN